MHNLIRVFFIYFTFFLGFVVSTVPWSSEYISLRPYWILIILLIWTIKDSRKVGYVTALVVGLLSDSLAGTQLGEHAIAFLIVTFINTRLSKLYVNVGFMFQTICTALLILIYSIVIFALELFSYNFIQFNKEFFLPILTSTIIWAWLFTAIGILQLWLAKRYRINFGK
ncbi:rod shape-determining protein MreD [Psittacicella gerlachiana]|uniref:Rod shape-determining protein MreD n=1 Tax=Psittacicella gerlachiana TaxID=2028574 RepID=A0A3A1YAM7_9GAMM|nr:rod shape-determining protein MreD [Psittacicella gerlachiana]RIY33177.1 rod shape-determining protein MreD [Psittacicella gerlachiana]